MPTAYKLLFYSASSARDWEFQGSNDGEEWTILSKHTDESSDQEGKCVTFPCEPAGVYRSFRLLAGGPVRHPEFQVSTPAHAKHPG